MRTTIDRLVSNFVGGMQKASTLLATMYKGNVSNGMSLVCELYMIKTSLKQERSEYGKLHRKEYESGSREWGGRTSMKMYVPNIREKSETITTVLIDNLCLEIYEL